MHDVSIRHNRHDGNFAPLVSIGLSYIDRLPVPVEPRTAARTSRTCAIPARSSRTPTWC